MSLLIRCDSEVLFGNDDGDMEDPQFLKRVYVESEVFKRAVSTQRENRLLCVRSRKGVGKSALLARARQVLEEAGNMCLALSPTDLALENPPSDYNRLVLALRRRLARLAVARMGEKVGLPLSGDMETAVAVAEEDGFRSADLIARSARAFAQVVQAKLERGPVQDALPLLKRIGAGKCLVIFIDDLDRGWSPRGAEAKHIRAALSAIREIAGLATDTHFRLAVREDVWQFLERDDEQIDKIRQYSELLTWQHDRLTHMLALRLAACANENLNGGAARQSQTLDDRGAIRLLFEPSCRWQDQTKEMEDVLTNLARRRPRDLVQLAKGAANRARKANRIKISGDDVMSEYKGEYSKTRYFDLCKEFKNECEEIEVLVAAFSGRHDSWVLPYSVAAQHIRSINARFPVHVFNQTATDQDCLAFLFRIGFLTAREDTHRLQYRRIEYEDSPSLIEAKVGVEKFDWEVHPAFRPYLESLGVTDYQSSKRRRPHRR